MANTGETDEKRYASVHYHNYLQLDKIVNAQQLRSTALGTPAHDELLFIITHQVYELWFKEIIHNLASIAEMFRSEQLDEKNMGIAVGRLKRIIEIFKVLIEQIRILETMTALDFLDFRNYLLPASGFQSFQFRKIESMLGLKTGVRITYDNKDYRSPFDAEQQQELDHLEGGNSMLELINLWLERTPFLEVGGFNFREKYIEAMETMIHREEETIMASDYIDEEQKSIRLKMLQDNDTYIRSALDPASYENAPEGNGARMSHKAVMAALLINLYRDEPILQMPYLLLSSLVEIDELLTTWRYRHAQMVLGMLGRKRGTGGSSGYHYLQKTVDSHSIYSELKNITSMLIPRSDLPVLPDGIKQELGFHFSTK